MTNRVWRFGFAGAWVSAISLCAVAIFVSLQSPLLAWRSPVYIAAGLAGVISLSLLCIQPLLAIGAWPLRSLALARVLHRFAGSALVLAIAVHVIGLWVTSPPDVLDALFFRSPTPFSAWGVIAMWAIFAAATLAILRSRLRWRPINWRRFHTALVLGGLIATVIHALQITGTMGQVSKVLLCVFSLITGIFAVWRTNAWRWGR